LPPSVPLASIADLAPESFGWLSAIGLVSGLALLLGGMEAMGSGLRELSGGRIRRSVEHLGRRPLFGVAVGAAVAGIIHSAGATTAILISLVEAGIMRFAAAIPVVMGANIGTTFTGQLLAFEVTWLVPAMLAGGLVMRAVSGRSRTRALGEAIYGAGLLFLGLLLLSAAVAPLRDVPEVIDWLSHLESVPLGLLAGLGVTVMFQSSTALIGVMIGLSSQGLLTMHAAIPLILGANIGSCSIGLIASVSAGPRGRRVAWFNLLFNVSGVLLFVFWIPGFADLIHWITPGAVEGGAALPREIANAHTVFNVAGTVLLLPLSGVLQRVIDRVVPARGPAGPRIVLDQRLLHGPIASPDLALAEAVQGARQLAGAVQRLVRDTVQPVADTSAVPATDATRRVGRIHAVRRRVSAYLNQIGQMSLRREEADLGLELSLIVAELDLIATLARDALELVTEHAVAGPYSLEGQAELEDYSKRMTELLDESIDAYFREDLGAAREVRRRKKELGLQEAILRRAHILRMREGIEASVRTDALHLAWLELMRQVNSHSGRIARILLDREGGGLWETAAEAREGPVVDGAG